MAAPIELDEDRCYDALVSRDARFDGQFIAAITSTGIYCRASCPAPVRPKRANVRLFHTAAAAQAAGFRSCKRCRPDASPGSPEWDRRADLVGRAMRLIGAGEVDRVGVSGLAAELAVSERHLHRLLVATVGAGPIALARSHRANLARILLETTTTPVTDIAFAAGFSSVRQFNDTIRSVYDRTPSELRRASRHRVDPSPDDVGAGFVTSVRLAVREPFDIGLLLGWFAGHGTPGVSGGDDTTLTRSIRLPSGPGTVTVRSDRDELWATFTLDALADLAPAIAIVRSMLDLDADPVRIGEHLAAEPTIAPLHARAPGVRVAGAADAFESAISAVVSQQVSVAAACTFMGRVAERFGRPIGGSDLLEFPTADDVAGADLGGLGLTGRRAATVGLLAERIAAGQLDLSGRADRTDVREELRSIPGIGPWTTDVISLRVLRDPDVLLDTDLVIRRVLDGLDASAEARARWSPWSSYVTSILWATARETEPTPE